MEKTHYKIIFTGEPLPGVSVETLKTNLAQLFKIAPEEAHHLIGRGNMPIKQGLSEAQADRYLAALQKAGAACHKESEFSLFGEELSLEKNDKEPEKTKPEQEAPSTTPEPSKPSPVQSKPAKPASVQKVAEDEEEWEEIEEPAKKPWQVGLQKIQALYAPPKPALLEDEEGEHFSEALNPYSAQGRIGRLRYLAWSMAALLTIGIPLYLVTSILAFISSSLSFLSVLLFLAGAIVLIVCSFRFTIQRLHDIGLSAWLVLLLLVPVVGGIFSIALMIWPGSPERTLYGPPPPPNSTAVLLLSLLWVPFFMFSLLPQLFRMLFR